jgi:hypothetical protein
MGEDYGGQLGYLLGGIDWQKPQHTWRTQAGKADLAENNVPRG